MINIKKETAILLLREYEIHEATTYLLFERGILSEVICRNILIKDEYLRRLQPKEKQRIKGRMAEKYCISIDLVRKLVE